MVVSAPPRQPASTANSCSYTGRQWIEPEECQAAGCCYLPGPSAIGAANAPLLLPPCFWPNTGASSYVLTNGRLDAAAGAAPTVPHAGPLLHTALLSARFAPRPCRLGKRELTLALLQATRSEASSRCSEALSLSWAPTSRP